MELPNDPSVSGEPLTGDLDVVVIGAGFAGLYAAYRLREAGFSFAVFEKADGVGGTWYWNRYPGARCDIPSMQYSYSFSEELQQEWEWTERYAGQPEILRYANHVADRFELRRHIRFETRVQSVVYDEARDRWVIATDRGDRVEARFVLTAVGSLSTPKRPEIAGIDEFRGEAYFTSAWPHDEPQLAGKRVAVIGTGSSGIQAVPVIAERAASVTVYQRTPAYTLPQRNRPLEADYVADYKRDYERYRERARASKTGTVVERRTESVFEVDEVERRHRYEFCWDGGEFGCTMAAFTDVMRDRAANDTVVEFIRRKVGEVVADPDTAAALTGWDYPFGARRVCFDTNFYETFNLPHVELVNIKTDPIVAITPQGIRTQSGEKEFDVIVFATGFDAFTGSLFSLGIQGRGGLALQEKWKEGPRTYLGVQTAGFPNLFIVTGPQSPSLVSNLMPSIEQHVDWITAALEHAREHDIVTIEADQLAEDSWVEHSTEMADLTLYPLANSYLTNANIAGKPRGFMAYLGGWSNYQAKLDDVAANGYDGFALSDSRISATARAVRSSR